MMRKSKSNASGILVPLFGGMPAVVKGAVQPWLREFTRTAAYPPD